MAQAFKDSELAQLDAAATKRAQAESWANNKPTKHAGLHPVFAGILAAHGMPQADLLDERATKALPRRFTGESITTLGDL